MKTRELTAAEMKSLLLAALNALPPDAKDNKIILFAIAELPGDNWINRISNMLRPAAEKALEKWQTTVKHRKTFGRDNLN